MRVKGKKKRTEKGRQRELKILVDDSKEREKREKKHVKISGEDVLFLYTAACGTLRSIKSIIGKHGKKDKRSDKHQRRLAAL